MGSQFRNAVTVAEFEHFLAVREIFDITRVKRYMGDYSIGTSHGTVSPYLIRGDGVFFKVNLQMLKEDKIWRVAAIDAELRLTPAPLPLREEKPQSVYIDRTSSPRDKPTLH
jgi:hypothetical protein